MKVPVVAAAVAGGVAPVVAAAVDYERHLPIRQSAIVLAVAAAVIVDVVAVIHQLCPERHCWPPYPQHHRHHREPLLLYVPLLRRPHYGGDALPRYYLHRSVCYDYHPE